MTMKPLLLLAAGALAGALAGAATPEEITARLTAIGAEQIQLQGDTKDIAEALDRAFRSGRHDTPEMKELRRKIDALQRELEATQAELRRQFEALPAFSGQVATVSTNAVRLRALADERRRLVREREAASKTDANPQ